MRMFQPAWRNTLLAVAVPEILLVMQSSAAAQVPALPVEAALSDVEPFELWIRPDGVIHLCR